MKKKYMIWMMLLFSCPLILQGKVLFSQHESSRGEDFTGVPKNAEDFLEFRLGADSLDPCAIHVIHDTVCLGDTARLFARADFEPPYTLRWYADCELTHLLKTEILTDSAMWSHYDTGGIVRRTFLFTTVEEGVCPTVDDLCADTMDVWGSAAMTHGVVVAEVRACHSVFFYDEVCQSQTAGYGDPYGVVPLFATAEELNDALRHAGTYIFTRPFTEDGILFFDSIFTLTVLPPPHRDTLVTISSLSAGNFSWNDKTFWESGHYAYLTTMPDGCDSLDILHLTILDVEISDGEICNGNSIVLEVNASQPNSYYWDNVIPPTIHVGDVVCVDGAVLSPSEFVESGRFPKGVVFYVDDSGLHGLALALTDFSLPFAIQPLSYSAIPLVADYSDAVLDMDGMANTLRIKQVSDAIGDQGFAGNAAAACYYYDHRAFTTGFDSFGWYLPSSGEWNILYDNMFEVNNTLWLLQNYNPLIQLLQEGKYWTSTVRQSGNSWAFSTNGTFFSDEMDIEYMVRAIIAF